MAAVVLAAAGSAQAASKAVQYGPPPAWVGAPPAATGTAPSAGAPVQMIYGDGQTRLGPDGDEFYTAYRLKILTAEALELGSISATWNPHTDDFRVHRLHIIRGGRTIDVLATNKFKVMQRENNLELAMLDGHLTANLQAPGLQVGDELEFAATIRRRDPTLGDRAQGGLTLPTVGSPGAYRIRLVWPKTKPISWRATPDLGAAEPSEDGSHYVLTYELRDPDTAITADGAPPRVNLRRFLQFSGFADWGEVSNLLWPLYERAATLAPHSPVKVEAARIAASTTDPAARAEAALRLVQERIRYVYVGLGDGNLRPASADDTWKRRFGDCKAKTALLLALLRELGIAAEAALVNSEGGDGLDERLPVLGAFDHVLVRATVDGKTHWLDGTRVGDRSLPLLPPPPFRWALPVRGGATELLRVEPEAPLLALDTSVLEIDASRGFDAPAQVAAEHSVRGDDAIATRTALLQLSKADAERFLRAYWLEQYDWVDPETTAWRYDERQNLAVLTMTGEGRPEWEGDDQRGHWLDVHSAALARPDEFRRPKEQDQTAPWITGFPSYGRWTTVIRLPPEAGGWSWTHRAPNINEQFGGVSYRREATLLEGVLRTTLSVRTLKPEITAEEAQEANRRRPSFDNKVFRVFQYKAPAPAVLAAATAEIERDAGKDAIKLTALGGYLGSEGRYDEALRAFDKALAVDPGLPLAALGKAGALEGKGDAAGALRVLDQAVRTSAEPKLAIARAGVLIGMGRTQDGLAALEALAAADPENVEVLSALAQAAQRAGRRDIALATADAALARAPDNVVLRRVRASIHLAEGRRAEAMADLEAAFRADPEDAVNLRNRGHVLRRAGRLDEALADLEEALRINPLDESTLSAKAHVLRLAGRGSEAIALRHAAVARARTGTALNNRCWEFALMNLELEQAEADCAEALKLEPRSPAIWDSYALVALRRGRLDEAVHRYDQALALSPKHAPSLYGRGLAKLRKGDETGGRADIAAAKAIADDIDVELAEAGITP